LTLNRITIKLSTTLQAFVEQFPCTTKHELEQVSSLKEILSTSEDSTKANGILLKTAPKQNQKNEETTETAAH
jgi:hypothetical protein